MEKILKTWLFNQCRMLSGSTHAVLLSGPTDVGPYDRALSWPQDVDGHNALLPVARAALDNKQAVIKTRSHQVENTGEPLDALACPLFLEGRLLGVVAIEMTHRSQSMQRAAVQHVQAGAKWLEAMILLHGSTAREQLVNLVDLVAAGLEHDQFTVAATEVTNELAERFACHRVSLGFMRYHRIRVEALSHTTRIDQHSSLVRSIRDAMTESLDQGACIVYPQTDNDSVLISRFHAQLANVQQEAAICTLPLVKNGKAVGALLLERDADNPFGAETVAQCEQIGLLLGPVLATRRHDERFLPVKVLESLQSGCAKLFGPRHLPLKVGVGLITVLLVWLSLASAMLRISCDSELEPGICRAIVAPQQGYIAEAHVRAGDLVRDGDLLATLEDQELRLEQRKWQSQRTQLLKEYRKALAGSDRAEIAILRAKRAQAEAQLSLVEQQLARTTLIAPFAGLVVKGDLSQALGSPVTPGEILFEVAPTDEYRVVMKVDDRDIGLIAIGQRGLLKLSGIPDQTLAITIDRLTPVSSTEEGRNYFRVEAVMDSHSDLMRPGMEGITKIEIGQAKLLWIWTRRLVDWLRLFVWNKLP
ncbi:efflux RND transporter periplasmic adaptor subunit [Desulfosarcina sp.]|uniref:efflux RND transporter periplasmic adaptor subunit n=1 Tax=Desulfosarcina sp. TaxID=2027861 RepID=UPI0029B26687|nr:HlyD family efflux transporter periplasmic adaptor subunit [Desulfosarcina sp.]MDX2453008.1 HlyD family efflux transporter periplasmic adaptor subunit [Desulfosarcina sp.]MDX2490743.1 HlyD family efflux transporter periplasmic adaptor subunit [Desulfosarcina sp.]